MNENETKIIDGVTEDISVPANEIGAEEETVAETETVSAFADVENADGTGTESDAESENESASMEKSETEVLRAEIETLRNEKQALSDELAEFRRYRSQAPSFTSRADSTDAAISGAFASMKFPSVRGY